MEPSGDLKAQGYIMIPRAIKQHEIYEYAHHLKLFLHLVARATYHSKTYRKQTLERGDCVVGRNELGQELKQNPRTTYDRLHWITQRGLIELRQINKQFTIVTICNYDIYQGFSFWNQQESNKEATYNQPESTIKKKISNNNRLTDDEWNERFERELNIGFNDDE